MSRILAIALLTLSITAGASAQALSFRINEVIPNPVSGDQIIEVINTSVAAASSNGYFICYQFRYWALPTVTVPSGGVLRVHIAAGTNTTTDVFTGAALLPLNAFSESVSFYRPGVGVIGFFANPANMLDFVQYGGGNRPRSTEAVSAGLWPATTAFAPTPGGNRSLAWDGTGDTPADWFRDNSPTPGEPNFSATAAIAALGPGCTLPSANAGLEILSFPALGNADFGLALDSDEANRLCALWFNLGSSNLPLFGGVCTLHVSLATPQIELFFTTDANGDLTLPTGLPDDPVLLGLGIGFQFLIDNAGDFPEFDMSEGVLVTF